MFDMILFLNTVLFTLIPSIFPAGVNSFSVNDGKFKENQTLHSMLLVVTLDGQLSALDESNNILWTKKRIEALLSTSRLSLLYNKNGTTVRAIPTFDGGLFECEKNSLVQLPVDHSQNQWKLSNSTTLRNTLETTFCILDSCTGRKLFCAECFDLKCNALQYSYVLNFTSTISNQVIVEKRVTHRVRLEESNSDVKKKPWSYIVTDVQLLLRNQLPTRFQSLSARPLKCDEHGLSHFYNNYNMCLGEFHIMRRSSNESQLSGNHRLKSPIAFAWIHSHGKLCKLDLFRTCHTTSDLQTSIPISSSRLFLGRYHNQIYLQTSQLSPTSEENATIWSKKLQHDLNPDFCQQCKYLFSKPASTDNVDKYTAWNICLKAHLATLDICLDDSNFENDFYVDEDWDMFTYCAGIHLLSFDEAIWEIIIGVLIIVMVIVISLLFACFKKCFSKQQDGSLTNEITEAQDCLVTSWETLFQAQQNETSALFNSSEPLASTFTDLEEEREFNLMPRLLPDFELLSRLGNGGFGTVFKVQHRIDQSIYAVKCIKLDANDADYPAKRLRESKVLAKLQHENIIRYYSSWIETSSEDLEQAWSDVQSNNSSSDDKFDTYENSDSTSSHVGEKKYLCIQTELCDRTLSTWLEKNKTSRKYIENKSLYLSIFSQILCGVNYIHVNGHVHLDLKPSNILFKGQTVKIADFGLVKDSNLYLSTESVALSFLGRYLAPECSKGKGNVISNKADIYSLGMIFFEMILPPYKTVHELLDVQLQLKNHHRFPEGFQSQYPSNSQLISQMMQKDPEARPSADEIMENELF